MVMRACGSGLGWPDFGSGDEEGGFWATTERARASDAVREADNKSIRVKVIICLNTILHRSAGQGQAFIPTHTIGCPEHGNCCSAGNVACCVRSPYGLEASMVA